MPAEVSLIGPPDVVATWRKAHEGGSSAAVVAPLGIGAALAGARGLRKGSAANDVDGTDPEAVDEVDLDDTVGDGDPVNGDEVATTDRRSALKKIGVGAAAAWVVPTILSQTAAAAASQPPPPNCRGCVSPSVANFSFETPVFDGTSPPTAWTFNAGTNLGVPYQGINVVPPPPTAVPGDQFVFLDVNGLGGVTMTQTVAVAAPCGDGTHAAALTFWWLAVDFVVASVTFTDGTNTLGTFSTGNLGPTSPTGGSLYPLQAYTSPSIPVPSGTTQAQITFTSVRGPNSLAQVGVDLVDLAIC